MLDFGCGCGRVLRHWKDLNGVMIHGTDFNTLLVEEGRVAVPFAVVGINGSQPPTAYPDGAFEFIYSLSVFTHFVAEQQTEWRDEIRRILKPGGYWLLTTHGEFYLDRLDREEQARFRAGCLVETGEGFQGENICMAYYSERYVREVLAQGFKLLEFVPQGALGNPEQDLFLLRREA